MLERIAALTIGSMSTFSVATAAIRIALTTLRGRPKLCSWSRATDA